MCICQRPTKYGNWQVINKICCGVYRYSNVVCLLMSPCEYRWDDKWQDKSETEIIASLLYSESRRESTFMDLRRSASLNIVKWLYQHLQYLGYKDINIKRKILGQNIRNPPYWIWLDSGRGEFSEQKQFPRACSAAAVDSRTRWAPAIAEGKNLQRTLCGHILLPWQFCWGKRGRLCEEEMKKRKWTLLYSIQIVQRQKTPAGIQCRTKCTHTRASCVCDACEGVR